MPRYVRCEPADMEVTETACAMSREKGAVLCVGCPGPAAGHDVPTAPLSDPSEQSDESDSLVVQAEAVTPPVDSCPGFFVDFTGHEDLLERFISAGASRGLKPGESALDLVYLFDAGLLCLLEEVEA